MSDVLTARQAEVLTYIQDTIDETGMPPTRAELALRLGFQSKNAASDHLKALERKGFIRLLPDRSRGIQLLQRMDDIPVIGSVAAGVPIEAVENVERHVSVPSSLFRVRPTYLLKVKGDSMKDAGILDGDLIAIQKTSIARSGQIVVARIDDEVTVKELKLESSHAMLLPANPAYKPIMVTNDKLVIEGVFVGLIRDAMAWG